MPFCATKQNIVADADCLLNVNTQGHVGPPRCQNMLATPRLPEFTEGSAQVSIFLRMFMKISVTASKRVAFEVWQRPCWRCLACWQWQAPLHKELESVTLTLAGISFVSTGPQLIYQPMVNSALVRRSSTPRPSRPGTPVTWRSFRRLDHARSPGENLRKDEIIWDPIRPKTYHKPWNQMEAPYEFNPKIMGVNLYFLEIFFSITGHLLFIVDHP